MTKRMTAEEVVAQFESYGAIARGSWNHAAQIVCDNLVPQWQDEPDGDGWYHLRDMGCGSAPQFVRGERLEPRTWERWNQSRGDFEPLIGQVCPIGARPQ